MLVGRPANVELDVLPGERNVRNAVLQPGSNTPRSGLICNNELVTGSNFRNVFLQIEGTDID